jgi:16S rRNA (uracil1498-N3)-methyltransferase
MNLVLFAPTEIDRPLDLTDDRARHVLKVLRRQVGDEFDVGLINGPRGKARVTALGAERLELDFTWAAPHPPPPSTTVIMGLPRPQTARDILRDATTLGATTLFFVRTARTDPNYASSSLWTTGEWERHLAIGAAQAFATHLPTVSFDQKLDSALNQSHVGDSPVIVLDHYEAASPLAQFSVASATTPATLLIGPERGWAETDRALFTELKLPLYHLGDRVLRTETAVTAALALVMAARARA